MNKQILATSLMSILVTSILSVVSLTIPAYAAAMSVTVSPSTPDTGKESTYTITFTVATRAFVKRVIIDFPDSPSTEKFDVSGAVLGHAEGIREDGSVTKDAGTSKITYEPPRKQRINADRIVSLTFGGIINPSKAKDYTISVTTEGETSGSTIDSGSDTTVTITASASSTGDGGLTITNTEGNVEISASNAADSADILLTAEDDVEINSGGTSIFLDAANDNNNEVVVSDTVLTIANINTLSATTGDGSITLEANGAANGDITIDAEDDIIMNADDITVDATGELDLNSDGDSITLDALDDGTNEIVITDTTNGVTGGTVTINTALSADTISVSTLTVTGTATIGNDAADTVSITSSGINIASNGDISDTSGAVTVADTFMVTGAAVVGGLLTATGGINMAGGTITDATDEVDIADDLAVTGAADIDGTLTLGSAGTAITFIKVATFDSSTLDSSNTETIADGDVTATSIVLLAGDDDTANGTVCYVNNIGAGSFNVDCIDDDQTTDNAGIADGTTFRYVVIG